MKRQDIENSFRLKPLKFPLRDTPHLTIETNRTCNLHCRLCYNIDREFVKTLDDVKKEIDLALKKRNLQTVTLLGGEPTLHPELPEIVAYIKNKNLICQLLTNGLVFLKDEKDALLERLAASGIDRILLHIDSGQTHVHKDIEEARRALFSRLEEKKIHFSLSLTLYEEDRKQMGRIIKKYSPYRYFDGILAVLARDPLAVGERNGDLLLEYKRLRRELNLDPTAYIPSNLNDDQVSWLIYYYFINAETGKTLNLSPGLNQAFRRLYRLARGRNLFAFKISPRFQKLTGLLAGVAEVFIQPKKLPIFLRLLKNPGWTENIRFHFIIIQTAPEFNPEKKRYEMCYHCPDATIRNGKLTPVCIADLINPLDGNLNNPLFRPDLYQEAYENLGEFQEGLFQSNVWPKPGQISQVPPLSLH
jgi:hypothetical protein